MEKITLSGHLINSLLNILTKWTHDFHFSKGNRNNLKWHWNKQVFKCEANAWCPLQIRLMAHGTCLYINCLTVMDSTIKQRLTSTSSFDIIRPKKTPIRAMSPCEFIITSSEPFIKLSAMSLQVAWDLESDNLCLFPVLPLTSMSLSPLALVPHP